MPEFPNVLAIETACLAGWPALETIEHLSWRARFSRGYTKRANSIQVLDPNDAANAGLRLAAMSGEYRARGIDPVFRVTPLTGPAVVAELERNRWERFEDSQVLTMDVAAAQQDVEAPSQGFELTDPDWSEAQARMAGYDADTLEILRELLSRVPAPSRGFLILDEDRRPCGAAMSVVVDGIAQFYNVVVDEPMRGRGFGRAVMQVALNWAGLNGAQHAAIQVLNENAAALQLYRSLGFTEFYGYHYYRDLT